jgi:hypothetical protein
MPLLFEEIERLSISRFCGLTGGLSYGLSDRAGANALLINDVWRT